MIAEAKRPIEYGSEDSREPLALYFNVCEEQGQVSRVRAERARYLFSIIASRTKELEDLREPLALYLAECEDPIRQVSKERAGKARDLFLIIASRTKKLECQEKQNDN